MRGGFVEKLSQICKGCTHDTSTVSIAVTNFPRMEVGDVTFIPTFVYEALK